MEFDWNKTKQLSVIQLVIAFVIPSFIAYIGFHYVLPSLVESGLPVLIAWPAVASIMLLALVTVSLYFLYSEARELGTTLAARMCLKNLTAKQWKKYMVIVAIALVGAALAAQLVPAFMRMTGLAVPEYMPFFLNPSINPMDADPSSLSPNFPLQGQYILIPIMAVTLLLNILAEELYFRAWLLPKMVKLGKMSWVISGVGFAFYHTFQLWLLPTILVASLAMSYVIYKTKSIWPAFIGHLVGNFVLSILGILLLVLG